MGLVPTPSSSSPEFAAAAGEALRRLVAAAQEDDHFRARMRAVLRLPDGQRESLVRTAVEEMARRGEPAAVRAAFLLLATPGGAALVAREIGG